MKQRHQTMCSTVIVDKQIGRQKGSFSVEYIGLFLCYWHISSILKFFDFTGENTKLLGNKM